MLAVLRSRGRHALEEVETQLGLGGRVSPPLSLIASRLGIKYHQLRYLLWREYRSEQDRRLRAARRQVSSIAGSIVTSEKLGFRIWLPEGWKVVVDVDDYEEEPEGQNVGWQSGHWQAEPLDEHDVNASTEVSKFEDRRPTTTHEFYLAQRPSREYLEWATRPPATFRADGLEAIRFYCLWAGTEEPAYQFSAYMADHRTGWIIECWMASTKTSETRPLFQRIVSSFRRIQLLTVSDTSKPGTYGIKSHISQISGVRAS